MNEDRPPAKPGQAQREWKLLEDQREANSHMITATIHAQEMRERAEAALATSEEAGRELRDVAELRELFMGILGHDLRTPLWSISMAAGLLLQRGHLVEQDQKTVARIINSSQRIGRMITQLLDLTRVRLGGGLGLTISPADLRTILDDVVDEFELARVTLVTTGDLTGSWDVDRLIEVLSNLVGNAIEHATVGTKVRVEAFEVGPLVAIEVSNEGVPIPAHVLPIIFEPFRRAQQREHSKAGNLGLGLYIANQIVLAHGGALSARSADGVTKFTLHLPRASVSVPVPAE